MKKPRTLSLKYVRLFFTGFSMGLADLVPGVSGGTIAFLFGIYDELLYSIKTITGKVPKLLLQGKLNLAIQAVPFKFLATLFLGMMIAILGFVELFSYLLSSYPVYVWSVFFGLVVGSAYVVSKRVAVWNTNRALLLVAGAFATFLIVGLPSANVAPGPFTIATTGAIASSAMVLPGISGSLIMVILGQYQNVIDAVVRRDAGWLGIFIVGAIGGLAVFARLLSWLLRTHHSGTIAFLVGVMIGSLRKVWPWQEQIAENNYQNTLPEANIVLFITFVLMIVGFALVWRLEKMGIAKEHIDIDSKDFKKEIKSQHD